MLLNFASALPEQLERLLQAVNPSVSRSLLDAGEARNSALAVELAVAAALAVAHAGQHQSIGDAAPGLPLRQDSCPKHKLCSAPL